jgi:uncharacterized HAD superfamily protein
MKTFKPSHGIAFDIDGIVLDSPRHMWTVITSHLDLPWSIDSWNTYDIEKVLGRSMKELRPLYEPVLRRHDLPMIKGAAETLQWLHGQYPEEALLFITSRREDFRQSAIECLRRGLGPTIPFVVECVDERDKEFEARNDKLELLREHEVTWFFEDNAMHWQKYIDAGIHISTIDQPWTRQPAGQYIGKTSASELAVGVHMTPKFSYFRDWEMVQAVFMAHGKLNYKKRMSFG